MIEMYSKYDKFKTLLIIMFNAKRNKEDFCVESMGSDYTIYIMDYKILITTYNGNTYLAITSLGREFKLAEDFLKLRNIVHGL